MAKNDVARNQWFYCDFDEMSEVTGTEPILIDVAAGKLFCIEHCNDDVRARAGERLTCLFQSYSTM